MTLQLDTPDALAQWLHRMDQRGYREIVIPREALIQLAATCQALLRDARDANTRASQAREDADRWHPETGAIVAAAVAVKEAALSQRDAARADAQRMHEWMAGAAAVLAPYLSRVEVTP